MKITAYLLLAALFCVPFAAGCGDAPTTGDKQFDKDLAAAASENKGKPHATRNLMKPPSDPTSGATAPNMPTKPGSTGTSNL